MRMQSPTRSYAVLSVSALAAVLGLAGFMQTAEGPPGPRPAGRPTRLPAALQSDPRLNPPCEEPERLPADSGGPTSKPGYYLKLSRVQAVLVTDIYGHSVDPFYERPTGQEIKGVSFSRPNHMSVLIMAPADQEYTITFQSKRGEVALELLRGLDNYTPDVAVRYKDLWLPPGVTGMLRVTPAGIDDLRLDRDGDGAFEERVSPDVSVSGEAARDTHGPTICTGEAPFGGKTVVAIKAADASGVEAIYYSLDSWSPDGMDFKPYDGPFEVDLSKTTVVHAVADDKVGNRSSRHNFQLKTWK